MADIRRLEQRLHWLEQHLQLVRTSAGLALWAYVFDGPLAERCREIPDADLGQGLEHIAAWPTLPEVLARIGVVPAYRAAVVAAVQTAVDTNTPDFEVEYPVAVPGGDLRWRLARGTIVRDPRGAPQTFSGLSIDITERKVAEERMQRATAMLELATKLSRVYVWQYDFVGGQIADARATFINVWESLGYDLATAPTEFATSLALVVLAEDQGPVMAALEACIRGDTATFEAEYRVRHADGSIRWNFARGIVTRDPDGTPQRFLGTSVDVTALKAAEEEARRNRERLELGVRGSGTTIFDIEMPHANIATSTMTMINGWELFGYDPATAPTDSNEVSELLIHPDDRTRSREVAAAYLAGSTPLLESEYRIVSADGAVSWRLARGQAVREEDGTPTRLLGSLVDITEIKRIEEELDRARQAAESANRAKDEFLANVSHEIRTPMNAILGMTELALDATETPHQRQLLSTVKVAARNLLQVINDLLDFSKIAAGKLSLDLADFSLRAAIGETVRALAVRAHRKNLELVCHVHQDLPDLYLGDVGRVRQVLMNLIGNAIKFTPQGEVVVEVMREPDTAPDDDTVALRFTVRDTGIGIAPEHHASIFRAFEQEDASTTRRFGGTGLGLTISAQLAALMGGRITVESEPGRGSTFTFTARVTGSARPEWTGARSSALLDDIDVLVVDDNETNRHILLEWFRNWRIRAMAVSDAAGAFAALESKPYSLVLLDGRMPDIDGVTLARRIRARWGAAAPKLILLSSDDRPEFASQARAAGLHAYLLKPAQQSELFETISAVLNTSVETDPVIEPTPKALPASRSLRILVAEDNELNVAVVRELLDRRGHRVEVASDGRVALELASGGDGAYDLMLLDLHMPEMDGFEVVEAIRERERGTARHLPIIALTARSSKRDRERALAAGMDDFLSKPIRVEQLWDAIERAMSHTSGIPPSRLLDPGAILRMCGGRPDVLDRLCEVFRRTVDDHLTRSREALEQGDLPRLRVVAHKLAGTLSAFSTVAGTLASDLEDAATAGELARCTELVGHLDAMCAEVLEHTSRLTFEALTR